MKVRVRVRSGGDSKVVKVERWRGVFDYTGWKENADTRLTTTQRNNE